MAKNLVIVESPAKCKTITKFLGKDFIVKASMGHIRDLPKKKTELPKAQRELPFANLAIDVESGFTPLYVVNSDKKKVVTELKKLIKKDTIVWIATDQDREGEAIGWHLLEALGLNKKTNTNEVKRIVFHEITKNALQEAVKNPIELDLDLVNSQQTRRILDRLVGYELSPLLWKKIRYGLSAGRVQSVALKFIVIREREIEAFIPEEYWSLDSEISKQVEPLTPFIAKFHGNLKKKIKLENKEQVDGILTDIKKADWQVAKITKKEVKRNPSPPFTTSTLQQEASRKLGFSLKKTMMVAQQLYEGIDQGGEKSGLITYMRTDSLNLSMTAIGSIHQVIGQDFGEKYTLEKPRFFSKKQKGAQEAHEAIRPTYPDNRPADLKQFLSADQFKLYKLIWQRTIACQMAQAKLEAIRADINVDKYLFRATGQTIKFAGFMKVYIEGSDDPDKAFDNSEKLLPPLTEAELLKLIKINPLQHFTKPPARYTEAALVKKMEEEGIGRPSTYAPTVATILARKYVELEGKALKPTDVGKVVVDFLVKHFENIIDTSFTANMENDLDLIAEGKKKRVPFLEEFYHPFHDKIAVKDDEVNKADVTQLEETDEKCEKCGKPMVVKLGKFGKFLSCTGYPDCKNLKAIKTAEEEEKETELEKEFKDRKCSKCESKMEVKKGRFGYFLGCSNYPDCKNIEKILTEKQKAKQAELEKLKEKMGLQECEKCGKEMAIKSGRFGPFLACTGYPDCKNIVNLKKKKK